MLKKINIKEYPASGNLNILIFFAAAAANLGCLYFVEQHWMTWPMWGAVILFSFVNNTLFSLLHEAVHMSFHSNRTVNLFFGRLCGFFFPTSFSLQQIYHLGHHRRNRTDDEMFDLYYEGDNLFIKKLTIFGIMSGIYWSSAFISCLIFFFSPNIYQSKTFVNSGFNKAFNFDAMLGSANRYGTPITAIRLEVLALLLFWALVLLTFKISFAAWILCYWAFGINWGSLQYTDHAFTDRDTRNGAWNLKVNPIVRYFFLNYHYHLVHHRYPNLPWVHLGKFVSQEDPMPTFFSIYWRLWRGPEKTERMKMEALDQDFEKMIFDGTRYS